MKVIRVLGPTRNRYTVVTLEWNNGKFGNIAIKNDLSIIFLGKNQLSKSVEKAVINFIIKNCPDWIKTELVSIDDNLEKERRLSENDTYGIKRDIFNSNIRWILNKKEYLKNALSIIESLKKII